MDSYEVDLRDYLRVMWARKWIILGVTAISLITGALLSYLQPNEYQATALIEWRSTPPVLNTVPIFAVEGIGLRFLNQAGFLTQEEAIGLLKTFPGSNGALDVREISDANYVSLRLRGQKDPSELEQDLLSYLEQRSVFFEAQASERISSSLEEFQGSQQFFQDQKDKLLSDIQASLESRKRTLSEHRDLLTGQMEELIASLPAGDAGAIPSLYYSDLSSRLQAVDLELIRLEADQEAMLLRPGFGLDQQLAEVEQNILFSGFLAHSFRELARRGWQPMAIIQAPHGDIAPLGPQRLLNVAIAGVLGLLLGFLAAFALHYLQASARAA